MLLVAGGGPFHMLSSGPIFSVANLEHDPEKHALAKARVDAGFRKRPVPADAGIMLHQ